MMPELNAKKIAIHHGVRASPATGPLVGPPKEASRGAREQRDPGSVGDRTASTFEFVADRGPKLVERLCTSPTALKVCQEGRRAEPRGMAALVEAALLQSLLVLGQRAGEPTRDRGGLSDGAPGAVLDAELVGAAQQDRLTKPDHARERRGDEPPCFCHSWRLVDILVVMLPQHHTLRVAPDPLDVPQVAEDVEGLSHAVGDRFAVVAASVKRRPHMATQGRRSRDPPSRDGLAEERRDARPRRQAIDRLQPKHTLQLGRRDRHCHDGPTASAASIAARTGPGWQMTINRCFARVHATYRSVTVNKSPNELRS